MIDVKGCTPAEAAARAEALLIRLGNAPVDAWVFDGTDALVIFHALAKAAEFRAQPQGEPVAYRWREYMGPQFSPDGHVWKFATHESTGPQDSQEPLFTHPDPRVAMLEKALRYCINQAEHDMVLTGDEIRMCRAALGEAP